MIEYEKESVTYSTTLRKFLLDLLLVAETHHYEHLLVTQELVNGEVVGYSLHFPLERESHTSPSTTQQLSSVTIPGGGSPPTTSDSQRAGFGAENFGRSLPGTSSLDLLSLELSKSYEGCLEDVSSLTDLFGYQRISKRDQGT